MTDFIQNYLADLENKQDAWETRVVRPYGNAYEQAYASFRSTIAEQARQDQLFAELVMVGLTVASGSLLTVVAGSALVRTAVVGGAVDLVCSLNMTKTFNMMALVAASKPASFALGKAWDEGARHFSKAMQDRVARGIGSVGRTPPGTLATPRAVQNNLASLVAEIKILAHDAAADVRDNRSLPDQQKNRIVAEMKAAKFWTLPKPLNETEAAKRIELGFYLTLIMNSDFTREVRAYQNVRAEGTGLSKSYGRLEPVLASPSSRSYPRNLMTGGTRPASRGGAALAWREGTFKNVGIKVQERVNALTGGEFFAARRIFQEELNVDHLSRAERALVELGDRSRTLMKIAA